MVWLLGGRGLVLCASPRRVVGVLHHGGYALPEQVAGGGWSCGLFCAAFRKYWLMSCIPRDGRCVLWSGLGGLALAVFTGWVGLLMALVFVLLLIALLPFFGGALGGSPGAGSCLVVLVSLPLSLVGLGAIPAS